MLTQGFVIFLKIKHYQNRLLGFLKLQRLFICLFTRWTFLNEVTLNFKTSKSNNTIRASNSHFPWFFAEFIFFRLLQFLSLAYFKHWFTCLSSPHASFPSAWGIQQIWRMTTTPKDTGKPYWTCEKAGYVFLCIAFTVFFYLEDISNPNLRLIVSQSFRTVSHFQELDNFYDCLFHDFQYSVMGV